MLHVLQVITVILVALAMALSVAHVAEFPGKRRLDRQTYLAVQEIYYPGFTIGGGICEVGGLVVLLILVLVTPGRSYSFWWSLAALVSLAIFHGIYWTVIHKINRVWLSKSQLGEAGAAFFSVGGDHAAQGAEGDWTRLRDAWEYSHVARSVFAMLSFVFLVIAVTGHQA
jgi:hypothetical protein